MCVRVCVCVGGGGVGGGSLRTHENAMSPASARSRLESDHKTRIVKLIDIAEKNRVRNGVISLQKIKPKHFTTPWAWIEKELKADRFEVHTQEYKVLDPLTGRRLSRTNVYVYP